MNIGNAHHPRSGASTLILIPVLIAILGSALIITPIFLNHKTTSTTSRNNSIVNTADNKKITSTDPSDPSAPPPPEKIVSYRDRQVWQGGPQTTTLPASVSHEFLFINDTDNTLELKDYERSCGCTDITFSTKTIPPGEVGSFRATMSLVGAGPRSTQIILNWKDGSQSTYTIAASAVVPVDITITPRRINLTPGKSASITITAVQMDPHAPPVPQLSQPIPGLTLTADPWDLIAPGDQSRFIPTRFQTTAHLILTNNKSTIATQPAKPITINLNIGKTTSKKITITNN